MPFHYQFPHYLDSMFSFPKSMASSTSPLQSVLLFIFLYLLSLSNAQLLPSSSSRPHGVILPVTKDTSTNQYLTHIYQRTPLVPVDLVVDLGGRYLWVDCEQGYVSSSYRPSHCWSAQCAISGGSPDVSCGDCYSPARPGCNNNTCRVLPTNTINLRGAVGELASDVVSIQSTDGTKPGQNVTIRRLIFGCAYASQTFLFDGLSNGVKGMAGLGRNLISLPSQFAAGFRFPRTFALCLSSSTGVIFFGDGPYTMPPGIDLSSSLSYTSLILNRISTIDTHFTDEPSAEYFIEVKSILIDGIKVPLYTKLLSINKENGYGGTKISTVNPYTVMETSIHNAFTRLFIKQAAAMNISRVAPVAPFNACFSMGNIMRSRVGFRVPTIDLVMQNKRAVTWRISASNSMVQARNGVLCLAFVNGGREPRTSIVIGGHQLEDTLLQFDIPRKRFGFSSSLLGLTTCSSFDFTSKS